MSSCVVPHTATASWQPGQLTGGVPQKEKAALSV